MASVCELRDEVIRLKNEEGLSFARIGQKLGFTKQRAHQLFNAPAPDPATTNGASRRTSSKASTPPSRPSNGLTVRQRKFVVGLAEGKSQTQAALDAGAPPRSAHVWASNTVRDPKVQETFAELLDRKGLSDERLAEIHAENLQAMKTVKVTSNIQGEITEVLERPDYSTRQRAVKDAWALRGRIGSNESEGGGPTVNISLVYETAKKIETLTGRRVIPANWEPVEDEPNVAGALPDASADDSAPAGDPNSAQADDAVWGDW